MGIFQRKEELYRLILDLEDEAQVEDLLRYALRMNPHKKTPIEMPKDTPIPKLIPLETLRREQAHRVIPFSEWQKKMNTVDWGDVTTKELLEALD